MPKVTPEWKRSMIARLAQAMGGLGLSARTQAIIIAHAMFESGWGTLSQVASAHNWFNITAGGKYAPTSTMPWLWNGPTIAGGDTEYDAQGNVKKITQQWRVYASDAQAVQNYLDVLKMGRYLPARAALLQGDYISFIYLLGPDQSRANPPIGGYYTLPSAQYLQRFSAVYSEVIAIITGSASVPPISIS
jgi:flagellum-specific peptidoglycan hydrolase FlgJ